MSDFFATPPGQGVPGQGVPGPAPGQPAPPADPGLVGPPGAPPLTPGMPGYSWTVHQQVRSEVAAAAPPAVPLAAPTIVVAVAALGGLLMVVGGWAPWVKVGVGTFGEQTVAGHQQGLHGLIVLAMGVAALLAAGTALTAPSNKQMRQICAGALAALGAIGLVVVIHDWTTLADHFRKANAFLSQFTQYLAANGGNTVPGFDLTLHIAKQWGLILSGAASVITGLAGIYLFLV